MDNKYQKDKNHQHATSYANIDLASKQSMSLLCFFCDEPHWEAQNYKIGFLGSERCEVRHNKPHWEAVGIRLLQDGATVVIESVF